MKKDDGTQMSHLAMTRIEAASVILISRKDLSLNEAIDAAERLNQAIQKNCPQSNYKDRVKIARNLAEQLGDPHPYMAASNMRIYYQKRENNESPKSESNEGEQIRTLTNVSDTNQRQARPPEL
jgi:G3E family GTPase